MAEGLYKNYPHIDYPFLDGKKKLVVDILKRFRITDIAKEQIPYWEEYVLQDEDSPEVLAHLLYGDSTLNWLVLMVNSVVNPNKDWMMNERKFEKYIETKYSGKAVFLGTLKYSKGDLKPGATVYSVTSTGIRYKATVVDWNRTMRRLIVSGHDVDSWQESHTEIQIENGYQIASPEKVVDFAYEAVHRFEDEDGEILDPLDHIDSYIDGTIGASITAFTIRQREAELNDAKRNIVLVRPEYVDALLYHIGREISKIKSLQSTTYETRTRSERRY